MIIVAIKTYSRYSLSIIYNPKHKKVLIQSLNDVKDYLKSFKHIYNCSKTYLNIIFMDKIKCSRNHI